MNYSPHYKWPDPDKYAITVGKLIGPPVDCAKRDVDARTFLFLHLDRLIERECLPSVAFQIQMPLRVPNQPFLPRPSFCALAEPFQCLCATQSPGSLWDLMRKRCQCDSKFPMLRQFGCWHTKCHGLRKTRTTVSQSNLCTYIR